MENCTIWSRPHGECSQDPLRGLLLRGGVARQGKVGGRGGGDGRGGGHWIIVLEDCRLRTLDLTLYTTLLQPSCYDARSCFCWQLLSDGTVQLLVQLMLIFSSNLCGLCMVHRTGKAVAERGKRSVSCWCNNQELLWSRQTQSESLPRTVPECCEAEYVVNRTHVTFQLTDFFKICIVLVHYTGVYWALVFYSYLTYSFSVLW